MLIANSVVHANFLNISSNILNESFDLAILDFPYGIEWSTNHRKETVILGGDGIDGDTLEAHMELNLRGLPEVYRVLRPDRHLYYFTRWDMLEVDIPHIRHAGFDVKNIIIWVKNNWGMGDLEGAYAGQYECIIFAHKGRRPLFRGRLPDVVFFDRVSGDNQLHSHQKPVPLVSWLIRNSSHEGEQILDPTCGVGTTIVSSLLTNRIGWGIEIDKETQETALEFISVLGNAKVAAANRDGLARQEVLL